MSTYTLAIKTDLESGKGEKMQKMIRTNDLSKSYGKQPVLDGINIEVNCGDIYGFVGRNGAGKTTLMRILMGLSFASSGRFQLLEMDNPLEARRFISAFIEQPAFYENMTAVQNLKNYCMMLGQSDENIKLSLELVGLRSDENKKVKHYSLGMKQRLALAKALTNQSKLIILDEPTNGLDPEGIEDLRKIIRRLNQEKGVTFLISSHYLTELQNVATRYGFIEKGKLCKEIDKHQLKNELNKKVLIETNHPQLAYALLIKDKKINTTIEIKKENEDICPQIVIEDNGIDITQIYELFRNNNINIKSIQSKQPTLEDYFFKVISGRKVQP
ncbi:MAG: ATP-binding cassette domain-containing protein [Eubacterium sp.]